MLIQGKMIALIYCKVFFIMKVDEIKKIAFLARLDVNDRELLSLTNDVNNILNFINKMNEVDTHGIAPLAHPLEINQRLRNDEVTETNQRELFLKNAPAQEAGLFLVPKVIEEV